MSNTCASISSTISKGVRVYLCIDRLYLIHSSRSSTIDCCSIESTKTLGIRPNFCLQIACGCRNLGENTHRSLIYLNMARNGKERAYASTAMLARSAHTHSLTYIFIYISIYLYTMIICSVPCSKIDINTCRL